MNIINLLISLYAVLVAIRVLMEATLADPNNPVGQMLLNVTNPLINLAEKLLPKRGDINFAGIAVVFVLIFLTAVVSAVSVSGDMPSIVVVLWATVVKSVLVFIRAVIYILIAQSIMSFISATSPIYTMLAHITAPLVNPLRKWVKPVGNFDIAPLAAFVILVIVHLILVKMFLPSGFSF